eukprot:4169131-Prymnesium_polylepis.1
MNTWWVTPTSRALWHERHVTAGAGTGVTAAVTITASSLRRGDACSSALPSCLTAAATTASLFRMRSDGYFSALPFCLTAAATIAASSLRRSDAQSRA